MNLIFGREKRKQKKKSKNGILENPIKIVVLLFGHNGSTALLSLGILRLIHYPNSCFKIIMINIAVDLMAYRQKIQLTTDKKIYLSKPT